MSSGAITLLVVAVCLIPLAGVFAAMDAALQRVSKARVEEMRREGVKRADALEEVVQERARHVALLLLLRIACEMVAVVLMTVVLYNLWGSGWRTALSVAGVMTVVLYVLVGVGPRTLGRQHAYGVALATAGVVRLLGRVLGPVATLLVLIFANYAAWYFAIANVEVLRNWRTLRPQGYWVGYDIPIGQSIFGFPLTNGWKAVGTLIADGVIDAPFDVHGKEPVADWYTRGQGYCPRDPVYYLWHDAVEPGDRDFHHGIRNDIEANGYQLFGEVTISGEPRLAIYKKSDEALTPQLFVGEEYINRFDQQLSNPIFEKDGPTAVPQIEKPVDFRFGDAIRLVGYTLKGQDNVPGGAVNLTLYWQADASVPESYDIFAQIIDRSDAYKAGQTDGEPACGLIPTDEWMPGQVIADRYYIPLAKDARATTYTLLIGMVGDAGNLEITTSDGASLGDAIGLDEVRIALP